uniref:Uncharacterized protein n=1 Tax=Rhizophora mucronata TaxID=61149 RepID=A0A2P2N3P2_RHIMU
MASSVDFMNDVHHFLKLLIHSYGNYCEEDMLK